MYYSIKTLDGYTFTLAATETYCIDTVNGDNADIGWANESELLAWVAENIENIGEFIRVGADSVVGI
jgi:hypothetical protein